MLEGIFYSIAYYDMTLFILSKTDLFSYWSVTNDLWVTRFFIIQFQFLLKKLGFVSSLLLYRLHTLINSFYLNQKQTCPRIEVWPRICGLQVGHVDKARVQQGHIWNNCGWENWQGNGSPKR